MDEKDSGHVVSASRRVLSQGQARGLPLAGGVQAAGDQPALPGHPRRSRGGGPWRRARRMAPGRRRACRPEGPGARLRSATDTTPFRRERAGVRAGCPRAGCRGAHRRARGRGGGLRPLRHGAAPFRHPRRRSPARPGACRQGFRDRRVDSESPRRVPVQDFRRHGHRRSAGGDVGAFPGRCSGFGPRPRARVRRKSTWWPRASGAEERSGR